MLNREDLKVGDILYTVRCSDDIENPTAVDYDVYKCVVSDQPYEYLHDKKYPLIRATIVEKHSSYETFVCFKRCYKTAREAGDSIVADIMVDMKEMIHAIAQIDVRVDILSEV